MRRQVVREDKTNVKSVFSKNIISTFNKSYIIKSDLKNTKLLTKNLGLAFSDQAQNEHTDHSTNIVFMNSKGSKIGFVELNNGADEKTINAVQKILQNK